MNPASLINLRLEELARCSEDPNFLYRPFCSKSAALANRKIMNWCASDQLVYWLDSLANIRIRSAQHDPNKKTLVVASHLDTVINAGKFDGPLGFLIAYEMLVKFSASAEDWPFNLEVIGFSDEEGVRFQTTYLGSSVVAGTFQSDWLDLPDQSGKTMREALRSFGCTPGYLNDCCIPRDSWLGYYEVHIEQGPVLQERDLSVGLVRDIYGQIRVSFYIEGKAGHAGTVPMDMRQDALCGLSEFVLWLENFAKCRKRELVATIGQCSVLPGASNVIPGRVEATIDLRSFDMSILQAAAGTIRETLLQISSRRDLKAGWREMQRTDPIFCDEKLNAVLGDAIEEHLGTSLALSSGAGHDAVAISQVAPVCMLFVRCRDGISHHPDEYVSPADIEQALEVSLLFLQKLKQAYRHEKIDG